MSSTRFNPPYPLIEDTNGDGTTFNKDDISQAQKETLGYYLSSLTKGSVIFTYAPYNNILAFQHWLGGYFPKKERRTTIQMLRTSM